MNLRILLAHSTNGGCLGKSFDVVGAVSYCILVAVQSFFCVVHQLA